MIRRFLLPVCFVVATAASAYTLQGTVVTADQSPMPGASVVLFTTDNDGALQGVGRGCSRNNKTNGE